MLAVTVIHQQLGFAKNIIYCCLLKDSRHLYLLYLVMSAVVMSLFCSAIFALPSFSDSRPSSNLVARLV